MRLVAIAAFLRARLRSQIDGNVENGFQRLSNRLAGGPAGEVFARLIDHDDLALHVGRDNAVFDRTQRHGEAFLIRGDFHLEALALGHIADHGDIQLLFVDHHFTQGNFNRERRVAAGAANSEGGTASLLGIPGACDLLAIGPVRFRN